MDLKKIIEEENFSDFPIGLGGCRLDENNFDSCGFDLVVFDGKSESDKILTINNEYVLIHHATFSETMSKKLLQYNDLQIIQDDSWDLRMFLLKIKEKRYSLFSDFAKNSLIDAMFCCQKTRDAIKNSDIFAPCWQKCASYYLADAILSLNNQRISPSHNLDLLRKLPKNSINEHISVIDQTVGIQRATPILLERMLKSTIGFSDLVEQNNSSDIIQKKHDFFIKNSMVTDCYFYLGYVNKENFTSLRNSLNRQQDLIHILKIAFDIEGDSTLLLQYVGMIQKSCNDLFLILNK